MPVEQLAKPADRRRAALTDLKKKKKRDWIEHLIVFAPVKLKPAAPSCWHDFGGLSHAGKITEC